MLDIFLRPDESYLVIEVLPGKKRAVLLSVSDERAVKIRRAWDDFSLARYSDKVRPLRFTPRVVVSAHPSLVYTASVPARVERDNPLAPLGPVEMENILGQALTRIFNAQRSVAAKHLGVEELDAVLVQSRVSNITLDGKDLISPIGVKGKKIHMDFEITFTSRELFEQWRNFFNAAGGFHFADISRAHLFAFKKAGAQNARALILGEAESSFHAPQAATVNAKSRGQVKWGIASLTQPLRSHWGLSEKSARDLYGLYVQKALSAPMAQRVQGLISGALRDLEKKMAKTSLSDDFYVAGDLALPIEELSIKGAVKEYPLSCVMEASGFTLEPGFESVLAREKLPGILAAILEFYYDKDNTPANMWLKRRVHWLTPIH